jgi:biopolymer transport protein ExbD
MAMSVGGRGRVVAEINVTPMADVMIVLLVIFMIATPFLNHTAGLTLPPAANAAFRDARRQRLTVTLSDDGGAALGGEPMDRATLSLRLTDLLQLMREDERIVEVKAGRGLPYATVIDVLESCREAGAREVALMTDPKVAG